MLNVVAIMFPSPYGDGTRLSIHQKLNLRYRPLAGIVQAWLGDSSTLNIGECPREENGSLLSWILQVDVPEKYYLSAKACRGILTRASRRGKKLQELLETALLEMIEWWQRGGGTHIH